MVEENKIIAKDDIILMERFRGNINSKNIEKLGDKIKRFKEKNIPLPIKLSLHPCSGKSYFCNKFKNNYNNIILCDFDNYGFNDIRRSKKVFKQIKLKKHCCLLGAKELDYNFTDNLIEINVILPYFNFIKYHKNRLLTCNSGWLCINKILKSREKLIEITLNNNIPFFTSISNALDFIINIWNT